jgi:hypothetical protein
MKAECAAETLVKNYHTVRRNFPEDCTLTKLKITLHRPGQALNSRSVRLPLFPDSRHTEVVILSALHTGRFSLLLEVE